MGASCSDQKMPAWRDSDTIGAFDYDMCCYPFGNEGTFRNGQGCCELCCPSMGKLGHEFDAAKGPKWDELIKEAEEICKNSPKPCCGCYDVTVLKKALEQGWVQKADEYLAPHNLKISLYATQSNHGAAFGIQIVKTGGSATVLKQPEGGV